MKTLLIWLFSISLIILSINSVYAQTSSNEGKFFCEWSSLNDQIDCSVNSLVSDPDCGKNELGTPELAYCSSIHNEDTCFNAWGYCQTCHSPKTCHTGVCPNDYSSATGTCASPLDICCLKTDIPPPIPNICYKCVVEPYGGHYCTYYAPEGETCLPNYEDEQECIQNCTTTDTFGAFTCDRSGNAECIPSKNGEFTGENAFKDCQVECFNPLQPKDKVFCKTSNPKDGSTENPASGLIYTAIGCIPVTSTPEFITWILRWAIGIGGGIALMLIIVASFQIMTSSGNPEKVQAGKELLTSAIAGLIMLIFSVFILKVIGVDILKLPGIN